MKEPNCQIQQEEDNGNKGTERGDLVVDGSSN